MNINNRTVLITGANRGIGRALVNEALKRGAKRVYAATRVPMEIADERVTPLTLGAPAVRRFSVQLVRSAWWMYSSTTPASPHMTT